MTEQAKEPCAHNRDGKATVKLEYIEDVGRYMMEVGMVCTDCGTPFQFLGLPVGLDMGWATISADGQTARLAVAPVGTVPDPMIGPRGFNVRRTL